MEIRVSLAERALAQPFVVSHSRLDHVHVVALGVIGDGAEGTGEVAVGPWTDTLPGVVANDACELAAALADRAGAEATVADVDAAISAARARGCPPLACLLAEMSFLDLVARRAGLPLWRLLDLPEPPDVTLLKTITLGQPLSEDGAPRYKVKLGGPDDRWVLSQLAGSGAEVIVDVNSGWDRHGWESVRDGLLDVQLLALEDPVRVDLDAGDGLELLADVRAFVGDVPVVLDESVHRLEHVERVGEHGGGANVKLSKFGGLLESRRALERLRDMGLRRMLGCFVEPPRSIAYAAQLAGLVDWADLDGHLWLNGDRFDREVVRIDRDAPGAPSLVTLARSS